MIVSRSFIHAVCGRLTVLKAYRSLSALCLVVSLSVAAGWLAGGDFDGKRGPSGGWPLQVPGGSPPASHRASQRSLLGAQTLKQKVQRLHPCLAVIIDAETGGTWSVTATNSSSGAYGLPQALPGSKMAAAGPDWRTNGRTQVRWALRYASARYGSECAAMVFWRGHGYW